MVAQIPKNTAANEGWQQKTIQMRHSRCFLERIRTNRKLRNTIRNTVARKRQWGCRSEKTNKHVFDLPPVSCICHFCGGQMLLVRPCWEAQLPPPHFPIRKENKRIRSLKLTYPLKIDSGKGDSSWKPSFLGAIYVSFRECKIQKYDSKSYQPRFWHRLSWWRLTFTNWITAGGRDGF